MSSELESINNKQEIELSEMTLEDFLKKNKINPKIFAADYI